MTGVDASAFVDLVVRQSLYAAVVALIVLPLTSLRWPKSPLWRAGLWSLVLIRLVLPVDLASPIGLGELLEPPATLHHSLDAATFTAGAVSFDEPVAAGSPVVPLMLVLAWLIGATFLSVRHLWLRLRITRAVRAAAPAEDAVVAEMLEKWRAAVDVARDVQIRTSDEDLPPFTLGVRRPVIFLPRDLLAAGDRDAIEATIAHELIHVRKLDDLWLQLAAWVRIAYFFHPVAWLAERKLRQSREEMCDESVLALGQISPQVYGRGLLSVLTLQLSRRKTRVVPAMAGTRKDLILRFQNIVTYSSTSRLRFTLVRLATLALAVLVLPMGPASASNVVSSAASEPAAQPPAETVRMTSPVPGARVTAEWGERKDPWSGKKRHHRGLDLAAPRGTEILAPAGGTVLTAAVSIEGQESLGTVIVLDHGGAVTSFFSHLGELRVREGDSVSPGQVIATIGTTGRTTGPHVHFEVRVDGEAVDPVTMME